MISPTDMGDYGEYECEASNTVGDVQRAKAFLNVQCMYFSVYTYKPLHMVVLETFQTRLK